MAEFCSVQDQSAWLHLAFFPEQIGNDCLDALRDVLDLALKRGLLYIVMLGSHVEAKKSPFMKLIKKICRSMTSFYLETARL